MSTDLVGGTVTSFKREQGFGTITLDDGRALPFDASACAMVPEEKMRVLVQVGKAKWGNKDKAVLVKPAEEGGIVRAPQAALTLEQKVGILHANHLVAQLTEDVLEATIGELGTSDPPIVDVLDHYYTNDAARAAHDGYLRHDWRFAQETDDVLAEIAALLPGARLPRQVKWSERDTVERGHREVIGTIHVAHPDGREEAIDVDSLDDIVKLVNTALASQSAGKQLYALETGGDWHAYLVLAPDRRAALGPALPFR